MAFINGQPYTSFRATNSKDGKVRLESGAYGAVIGVPNAKLSADRTIDIQDATGTLVMSSSNATVIGNTSTLTIDTSNLSAARTVAFRDIGGSIAVGVFGTLAVDLTTIAGSEFFSTVVAITDITSNDVLTFVLADSLTGSTTTNIVAVSAQTYDGGATLTFAEIGGTGRASGQININYIVVKP